MNTKEITVKQLSKAQYRIMEEVRRNGKVSYEGRNRKSCKQLMEWGLLDYNSTYDHMIQTRKGAEIEL